MTVTSDGTLHPRLVRADMLGRTPTVMSDCGPGRSESLADVIEWLFIVFEQRLGLTAILGCVYDCTRELAIDTDPAALDRVEQVAFDRLVTLASPTLTGEPKPAAHVIRPSRPSARTGPRPPRPASNDAVSNPGVSPPSGRTQQRADVIPAANGRRVAHTMSNYEESA
jgi:hypothetical protein